MFTNNATLNRIVDGDTAKVDIDLGFGIVYSNQTIRFWGIDTPESRTRDLEEKYYGKLASQYVKDRLVVGEKYQMRTEIDKGKYGRILGEFFIDGVSLNQQMIDENMAVKYLGQSKEDIEAELLENRLKLNEKGFIYENI